MQSTLLLQLAKHCSTLFTKSGATLENQFWIDRKRNAVLRYGKSSFALACKLRTEGKNPDEVLGKDYAGHGGGFPIRVKGYDGIVAVVVVSGLREDSDHGVIIETFKEYITSK